jgi:hypothetical protein
MHSPKQETIPSLNDSSFSYKQQACHVAFERASPLEEDTFHVENCSDMSLDI